MSKWKIIFNFLFLFLFLFFSLNSCNGTVPGGFDGAPQEADVLIRVLDKTNSRPIANARVSLKKDNETVGEEQLTDSNGEVVFNGIAYGDGYIAFINNALGYKSAASPMIKVVTNSEANVLLDRIGNGDGSGLIAGSVKDRATKLPIPRVSITYSGPQGSQVRQAFTDENGTYVIEGLIAGNYLLTFSTGNAKEQRRVTVLDGQSSNIETIFMDRNGIQSTGNFLVSLSGARKVVEINKSGNIIWSFSQLGSIESSSRLNTGDTVITDSNSSKVLQINSTGNIVKTFGSGSILNTLKYPSWVDTIDGSKMLVTDNGANKIIEITNGSSSWSFNTGLSRPRSAVYLNNGNILIADTGNRRVIEITRQGQVAWSFAENMDKPVHAVRLANGNTLITDSGFSRVLEVSSAGKVVWWYAGDNTAINTGGKNQVAIVPASTSNYQDLAEEAPPPDPGTSLLFPRSAVRLSNGDTLIADTGNNRIIEISQVKNVVWQLGNLPRPVSVERL
jgi:hypothetical protein